LIEATLHQSLPPEQLVEVERVWGPYRRAAIARLRQTGVSLEAPQHWHWDWTRKAAKLSLAGYQCVGIECAAEMQGLMMTASGHQARLAPDAGQELVYVDYLESAPWNVRPFTEEPRFGAVGARLIWAAVEASIAAGLEGRVGLHSLPQAEAFYQGFCGMTNLGEDREYETLAYFEFTRAGAAAFLARGEER